MKLYNFFSMLYISTVGKIIENLSPMNWDTIKTSLNETPALTAYFFIEGTSL